MVSAVIPALNEAGTIREVVSAALACPSIGEVIVVDDGSTDGTADIARKAGARVIVNEANLGKAMAMDVGVRAAKGEIVLFLDADVVGFSPEMFSLMTDPVVRGEYEMFLGIRTRKSIWLNRLLHFFPLITGERAVTKGLWNSLPPEHKKGFMIETALNYAAKKTPKGMGFCYIPGTRHVIKERKYGLVKGFCARIRMLWQVVGASLSLYVVGGIREAFKGDERLS